jgi:hypothetical protein
MANPTMTLIASYTVSSSVNNFTFSSIPSTYTDLKLVQSARGTDNTSYNHYAFNSSTSSQSGITFYTETSTPTINSFATTYIQPITSQNYPGNITNAFASAELYIPNYNSSNYKSVLADGVTGSANTSGFLSFGAYLWSNTSPITSITVYEGGFGDTGTYLTGSTFYLYGINNS